MELLLKTDILIDSVYLFILIFLLIFLVYLSRTYNFKPHFMANLTWKLFRYNMLVFDRFCLLMKVIFKELSCFARI